jgi:hypothetical protein
MSGGYAEESPDNLCRDVAGHLRPLETTLRGVGQCYGWIEMRPRDRPKREDEGDQRRAGCKSISEERYGQVATAQAVTHDAGTNNGGE